MRRPREMCSLPRVVKQGTVCPDAGKGRGCVPVGLGAEPPLEVGGSELGRREGACVRLSSRQQGCRRPGPAKHPFPEAPALALRSFPCYSLCCGRCSQASTTFPSIARGGCRIFLHFTHFPLLPNLHNTGLDKPTCGLRWILHVANHAGIAKGFPLTKVFHNTTF